WRLQGVLQANYLIGVTGGEARVLLLNFVDQVWGPWITEGFRQQLEGCPACEIVSTLDVTNADWIEGTAVEDFAAALHSATDANAVAVPIDGWFTLGIADALAESGRSADIWAIGRGG